MASEKREAEDCVARAEDCAPKASAAKLYVCLSHTYGPVIYSIYEITVPNPIPPPPTKSEAIINSPNPLPTPNPILQLKSVEYPVDMCCVQLGSKFYLFGGKYHELDPPSVDQDVDRKYQHVKRFIYPLDLYIFDPTTKKLINGTPMNTGKAHPLAFVIDHKIYVLGSTYELPDQSHFDLLCQKKPPRKPHIKNDIETHALFEVYDPVVDKWTVLPNQPPIRDNTEWSWHSIVGNKVLLVACEISSYCLYCFDFDTNQWANYLNLPFFSRLSFFGGTEFVEGTLYGCQRTIVAAIKDPLAELLAEEGTLYHPSISKEMDAIYHNLPPLVDSYTSSSLLHLGNGFFCFLVSGNPELPNDHFQYIDNYPVGDDKKRVIRIVIFQALGETYGVKKDYDVEYARGLFTAKFMYSAHCVINTPFPNQGRIEGFFSLGSVFGFGDGTHPMSADHGKPPVSNLPSNPLLVPLSVPDDNPLLVPQSVPDVPQLLMNDAMALIIQSMEDAHEATTQSLPPISVEADGVKEAGSIVIGTASAEAAGVDDAADDNSIHTNDDFITTARSWLLGKRKRTDHPHPRWHPLATDVESVRLTRPCDVLEITKKHDVYSLEFTAVQSEMASLKHAWDAANRALIEERQSIFGRLEYLYQSLISKLFNIRSSQDVAHCFVPQPITSFVPSSSQPTVPLASKPSGDTSFGMETLDFSKSMRLSRCHITRTDDANDK